LSVGGIMRISEAQALAGTEPMACTSDILIRSRGCSPTSCR
jgi:hypothetical protein